MKLPLAALLARLGTKAASGLAGRFRLRVIYIVYTKQPAPHADTIFLRLIAGKGYHFQFAVSPDGENWIACGEAADDKKLPPWGCGVRVALTAGGVAGAEGVFDSFSIRSSEKP